MRNAVMFNVAVSASFSLVLTMLMFYMTVDIHPFTPSNRNVHLNSDLLAKCKASPQMCMAHQKIPVGTTNMSSAVGTGGSRYALPDWTAKIEVKRNPEQTTDGRKYLIPLMSFGLDTQRQHESFKIAAKFALFLHRTIALTPLVSHTREGAVSDVVPIEQLFSVETIADLLPIATFEEFQIQCNNDIDFVLQAPQFGGRNVSEYQALYTRERVTLWETFGIRMPGLETMPKQHLDTIRQILVTQDLKCIGLYFPLDFVNVNLENDDTLRLAVNTHFTPSPIIDKLADAFLKKMCDGGPVVALHWRNRTGELCEQPRVNRTRCNEMMVFTRKSIVQISEALVKYMNDNSIQCLYVAHPPYSKRVVSYLSPLIPRVYSSSDLAAEGVVRDEFYTSLVEQEICSRSEVFFSCNSCSWSRPVMLDRIQDGKKTFFISQIPGISHEFSIFM